MKTLIINADDFGLTNGVNDAVIDTFLNGSVTSATLLVNASATEDAVDAAHGNPGLGVGLHFNLTLGKPVSDRVDVSTLVDGEGCFYSRSVLARRLMLGRIDRSEVGLELNTQYERMKSFDLEPTHVDSHQHVHGFPIVFDSVAKLCESEAIPMRVPWILSLQTAAVKSTRKIRQVILKKMLAGSCRRWAGRVKWNTGLGSIFDLGTLPDILELAHYRSLLEAAPEGVFELMVHPAKDANELKGLTQIGDLSEREWLFLSSENMRLLISDLGFTLGNYRDL